MPLGHIGRLYAAEVKHLEYAQCHERAGAFKHKFKGLESIGMPEALKLLGYLLSDFGERKGLKLLLNSPEVHRLAGAHYNRRTRTIHFPTTWISTKTLLHEFTHHLHSVNKFTGSSHGKEFCDIQDLVFTSVINRWL